MIILVTGWFPIYKNGVDTGRKEFVVSHGIDVDTDKIVIVSSVPPLELGAKYNMEIGEWVL